jgi:hypothetical protein
MKKRKEMRFVSDCRILLVPKIKSFRIGSCRIIMAVGNDYKEHRKQGT